MLVERRWIRCSPHFLALSAVAAIVIWGVAGRLRFLLGTPEPTGVDGYYYAIQMRSLLQGDGLYYPGAPLTFWWLAPFSWFFGPIVGVKVGAALGTTLGAIPALWVARRLTGRHLESLFAATLVVTSAQGLLLSSEFVKQGIATTLLLLFLALLGEAHTASRRRSFWWAAVALALLGCALAHKAAFGVAIFFLVCFAAATGLPRLWERLQKRRGKGFALGGAFFWGSGILGVGALAGYAGLQFMPAKDLALLSGVLKPLGSAKTSELVWHGEAALAGACALVILGLALLDRLRHPHRHPHYLAGLAEKLERPWALLIGPLLFSLFLCLPWLNAGEQLGLAPRLLLMGCVCLCVLGPVLLSSLLADARIWLRAGVVGALVLVFLLAAPKQNDRRGFSGAPIIARSLEMLRGSVPDDSLLVTPNRQLSFQATWVTGLEAQMRVPEALDASRSYRLLVAGYPFEVASERTELIRRVEEYSVVEGGRLPAVLPFGERRSNRIVAVPEPTWQAFLASLDEGSRSRLDPWAAPPLDPATATE